MPQINRIRIINFSYNNHNRHIIDESFDFYQGENALLNLKNGGGKSVLVQLLLQPIIPKTRLMSRRIEDFFKGKKTPAYILIEWKLEDQGGYLLTGIGLTNRETQVREQDDVNNSLKYFTFTANYRESNLFDIENIPLVKRQAEKIYIEDFKEARKLIAAKEKDLDYRISVFTDEDKPEYRKHLASYNISQDEWRSIILKINESEGGVIEIFGKCKTSQQLMNDWILKSIEKVVNKEDQDQKKLEQMLENLVEEMISNEQFIYEKEIYETFLKHVNEYLDKLNRLVRSLEQEDDLENKMVRMYYYLKYEINKVTEAVYDENERIAGCEKELQKIDLEERSRDYYECWEKVNRFTTLCDETAKKLAAAADKLNGYKQDALVQEASRDYGQIKRLRQSIAGIKEEIGKIKNSDESKEKIRDLEYSLKTAYKKVWQQSNEQASGIRNRLNDIAGTLHEYKDRIEKLDSKRHSLQREMGRIESHIERFEQYEKRVKADLELAYERNLLGEIEKDVIEGYLDALQETLTRLNDEKNSITLEIEHSKEKISQTNEQIRHLRADERQHAIEATRLEDKIDAYDQIETSIRPVFEKYDLDWNRRFNHQENQAWIINRMNELQKTERELDLNVRTTGETMTALKNGTLHVSNQFREWLIHQDIAFETGENYLRNQSSEIRSHLVKQNPILPFAFLLYDEDIEQLKEMEVGLNIQQMVPILSYSDINRTYAVESHWVQLEDKLQFFCLYDHKMIDAENLESYLKELEREWEAAKEQLAHYRGELESAREDLQLLKRFNFDKNDRYDLESQKNTIENKIDEVKHEIKELEDEQVNILAKIDQYNQRMNTIERQAIKTAENRQKFNELIEEDQHYLQNIRLSQSYSNSIENMNKEKKRVQKAMNDLDEDKDEVLKQEIQLSNKIKETKNRLQNYEDAEEGSLIDDAIDNMEVRLQTLKRNITSNLEQLEFEYESKQKELKGKQDILKAYQLAESEYVDITYDSDQLKKLQSRIAELEEEKQNLDKSCREIEGKLQRAQGKLESAEQEVQKLAESPLAPSCIKLNFPARRKEEKESILKANQDIKALRKVSGDYEKMTQRIEGQVDVKKHEVNGAYEVKQDIHEDYKVLIHELKDLKQENKKYEENARNQYFNIKATYHHKNKHIENIFMGLDPLIEGSQDDNNKYYYLGERFLMSHDALSNLIRVCEQRLSNVEKNKNDMIQHSYLHAKQVYDEIQKIAENSSIKLEGKSRPIPMLRINMIPPEETEEENHTRMKDYIENCVRMIKEDMKTDKKIEDIRKKISKYMSTKELLNVLSDLGKMSIDAYKIDINVKNSRYKTWEQVMKENSGGERFVSFFAVLVALMSYTRTSMKLEDDYQRNRDTKVLIMDNPFGPISSEHLLKPLFTIAGKYHTQLICLTDLKQNSILNCFDLIYMIKIRQNVLGTHEYIQLEQQLKEEAAVEKDERLEKAVFKAENVEQISLF